MSDSPCQSCSYVRTYSCASQVIVYWGVYSLQVLDLTHDQNAPFCVEFDDQRWRQHLARLKPLGLAAVLNTCAPAPRHTYAHFCAHLTCEAQYR